MGLPVLTNFVSLRIFSFVRFYKEQHLSSYKCAATIKPFSQRTFWHVVAEKARVDLIILIISAFHLCVLIPVP